jgi:hypothetical protein
MNTAWKSLQRSDEEQWSLKQKLTSFEVERRSFEKEKEFLRTQIANDQQKVQVRLIHNSLDNFI